MFYVNKHCKKVQLTPPSNFTSQGLKKAGWTASQNHRIQEQFLGYVNTLKENGIEVQLGEPAPVDNPDAIYSYDSCLCLPDGAIILQSIKENRQREVELVRRDLQTYGIPLLGEILHPAHIDGGDILWLRHNEVAVGRSWRTNHLAILTLQALLNPLGISVRAYDLSNLLGKERCLHLMSVISMLDSSTALIYEPGMPIALLQRLEELSIQTIALPEEEWHSLGGNVLSLGNGKIIAIAGNPNTKSVMEAAGFEVISFDASDLCLAGEGGPTCLTRFIVDSL